VAKKGRFTEARAYVAGGSVALLLGVWGLLAAQDAHSRNELANASPTPGSVFDSTTSPRPTPTPLATGSGSDTQPTTAPRRTPQPTPKPHAQTHGS